MANPYEQRDDPFKERPSDSSRTSSPAPTRASPASPAKLPPHTTMITPLTQPQTAYAPGAQTSRSGQPQGSTGGAPQPYNPQPAFYGGASSPASPTPPPPPPPTSPATQYAAALPSQPEPQQELLASTSKFWTIEFYQQFFDVDTRLVLLRMSNTMVPINPPDFLMDRDWRNSAAEVPSYELREAGVTLSRKPDLYGPFWICTTLWMTLGIVSNIMSKIAFSHNTSNSGEKWGYDFTMASIASIVIYLYCFGLGCITWGLMKYKELPVALLDTICLYGYSMFIFLPVTILCTIPVSPLQWIVVMVGGVWSTAFLLINFWHLWRATLSGAWFMGIVTFVGAFHMLLTMSFKFYFLNYKF
ncbi:protein YIPF2 [Trypanosoma grayi]|uniref:protein YIPF2 n=1 Tax=Trypanosoma grayi TaxID=71804 RepID=UPI0004F4AF35|nr:protein YIPF2 [Trypanosoma grayi]KEG10327.1 protein YIPF2 [Trypanosoma grayi]